MNRSSNIGVRAPEFPANHVWINSKPLSHKMLKGKTVLVDFWTYSCVNCLRTLPRLREWHKKYAKKGLVIVGVHTPEFTFEGNELNVRRAVEDLKIEYPVVLDSKYAIWNLYANHWWPRKLLVDKTRTIIYDHIGEGGYAKTEEAIQRALVASGARGMPKIVLDEDGGGGVCEPLTQETYLGFERGRYANANIVARHRHAYKDGARTHGERPSLEGAWTVMGEYVKSHGSSLYMPYMAGEVNIVMDANGNEAVEVEILRNGKMVPYTIAGDDVSFVQNKSVVRVDAPRMYRLLNAPNREEGVLELRVDDGARLYAFTFGGGCG